FRCHSPRSPTGLGWLPVQRVRFGPGTTVTVVPRADLAASLGSARWTRRTVGGRADLELPVLSARQTTESVAPGPNRMSERAPGDVTPGRSLLGHDRFELGFGVAVRLAPDVDDDLVHAAGEREG